MRGTGKELVLTLLRSVIGGSQAGTAAGSCYQPWARRTMRRGNVRRAGRQELTPPAAGLGGGGLRWCGREQKPTHRQKPSGGCERDRCTVSPSYSLWIFPALPSVMSQERGWEGSLGKVAHRGTRQDRGELEGGPAHLHGGLHTPMACPAWLSHLQECTQSLFPVADLLSYWSA